MMTRTLPTVTVVTPSRGRWNLLRLAMRSVSRQVGVDVEHIVIGDRCPHLEDPERRAELEKEFPKARVRNVTAEEDPDLPMDYRPARLAYLRNLGARSGTGAFVAHLDDDNTFAPEHLSSLVTLLEEDPEAGAAYSWRRLFLPDGRPFIPQGEDPWHPDPERRVSSYEQLRELGVFVPGSHVVRDRLVHEGRLVARVDTSEFLVRREVQERIPFPERYSAVRRRLELTEDVVFGHALYRAKVKVLASERATVNYTMGGYSNVDALPPSEVPVT